MVTGVDDCPLFVKGFIKICALLERYNIRQKAAIQ